MGRQRVSVVLADVVARELNARGHTSLTAKSNATNIKRTTLDRKLKAQRVFTIEELAKIAAAIGWTLAELTGAAEDAA